MANQGELLISRKGNVHRIKVTGRATFDCAPPLRDLAKTLETTPFDGIQVDLSACEWMDSTFMGVLAMLGLRAHALKVPMDICAAGDENISLLTGLGLKKLFNFADTPFDAEPESGSDDWKSGTPDTVQAAEGAQTVLEAHQTLMGVDEGNVQKFQAVVDLVQADIDRINNDNAGK